MDYPRIYLVLDNCFAIKRWVTPADWMRVIQEIGASYVEASTDNECDPLFSTSEYLDSWAGQVLAEGRKRGMRIANFYTGYQTYRTVGLAHHDPRIRAKLRDEWLKPMVRLARKVEAAGIGFSFFAMPDDVLQSPEAYARREDVILGILSEIVEYAWSGGRVAISVEQMYAPHQPPWTIQGSRGYLSKLFGRTGKPSYITIDVGHQVGQRRFLRPGAESVGALLRKYRRGENMTNVWLGPSSAYERFLRAAAEPASGDEAAIGEILAEMDRYPYLFAQDTDGDTYAWLEQLGCYSPIIHMQQTDGISAHHAPFTAENNRKGIIEGRRFLEALARSYQWPPEDGMPPRTDAVYLSMELFAANTDFNRDTLSRLKESMAYWRRYVPRDGARLDELLAPGG